MATYWIPGQIYFVKIFLIVFAVSCVSASQSSVQTQERYVDYGEYGRFEPFATDPDVPLPMAPDEIDTKFILYTRPNSTGESLNATRSAVEGTAFDPSRKTKILVHGFAIHVRDEIAEWVPKMTEVILTQDENVNVIQVNWVKGARVEYEQAVANTRLVGAQIAYLIRKLMEVHDYSPEDIHIIGFSLGAHVAGFAGKSLKDTQKKLGRITGLDPANPGFNFDEAHVRLDKTDASFVDVIHTDTNTLLVVASGLNRNIGHADYYPNGGSHQPGCSTWNAEQGIVSAVTDVTVCDHVRAPKLFMNSINSTGDCDFAAYRCPSYENFKEGRCVRCAGKRNKSGKRGKNRCNKMGYWAEPPNTKNQVKYFLQTGESTPYCAKHYQVQMHWRKHRSSSKEGFRGSLFVTLHGEKGITEEFKLNDGATFHIVPGKTSRFLVSQDCSKDIGNVDRVTFRWERPTCWTWFFCSTESVYVKRVKIIDAAQQKRFIFLPLEMDRNNDGRKDIVEVPSGDTGIELFRKSYIRSNHPERLNVGAKVSQKPVVQPQLVQVPQQVEGQVTQDSEEAKPKGRLLLERISNHKGGRQHHHNASKQFLNSSNTGTRST